MSPPFEPPSHLPPHPTPLGWYRGYGPFFEVFYWVCYNIASVLCFRVCLFFFFSSFGPEAHRILACLNSSVQFSCLVMFDFLRPHGMQHTGPPCPSPTPKACSNSCPSSWWCHPIISSSVVPFSSCLSSPSRDQIQCSALEGKVLTTETPGKSLKDILGKEKLHEETCDGVTVIPKKHEGIEFD